MGHGLTFSLFTCFAESENMNKSKTIRVIYPQWQGGNVARILPELTPEDASKGYILGAHLLNFLAPETENKIITIPISDDINRVEENGIIGYKEIFSQTVAALKLIRDANPFTYHAEKYDNDIAMVWIDAHPDKTLPEDKTYNGYHAMAVTAIMGKGDKGIISVLPAFIPEDRILFVGLRDWERQQIKDRQKDYGVKHLTPRDVSKDSHKILDWLKSTGAKHVVIHFDMDVLDPNEIIAAVGVVPGGMKIDEVTRVINDIAKEYDVVGLTVAEPMPRIAIKLKNMLNQLPLIK